MRIQCDCNCKAMKFVYFNKSNGIGKSRYSVFVMRV